MTSEILTAALAAAGFAVYSELRRWAGMRYARRKYLAAKDGPLAPLAPLPPAPQITPLPTVPEDGGSAWPAMTARVATVPAGTVLCAGRRFPLSRMWLADSALVLDFTITGPCPAFEGYLDVFAPDGSLVTSTNSEVAVRETPQGAESVMRFRLSFPAPVRRDPGGSWPGSAGNG